MMNKNNLIAVSILTIFSLLLLCDTAIATVPDNNALDIIQNRFFTAASSWGAVLTGYAVNLFWILAAIDFVWMAISLALNQGEFSDWAANLCRKVLVIGFFWALVQPVGGVARGVSWATDIVQSLVTAGGSANSSSGGVTATPSDVFDMGLMLCQAIAGEMGLLSPISSLGLLIGGFVVMVVFALIAAMMLLVYIQTYIVLYGGILFLGFGGSAFSKDIALSYFRAALSAGSKLMIMILIVGIGQQILQEWTATVNITFTQIALYIGAAVVLLALVKVIPDMVGDLINGFSWGAGEPLAQTGAKAVKGAIGATVGAVGGAMAVSQAAKLASASGAQGMAKVGATASNLWNAAKQDTAGALSGKHWGQGTKGGRMSSLLKAQTLKTKPPEDEPYHSDAPNVTGSFSKDKKRKE